MRSPILLGAALAASLALTLTACGAPAPVEPEPVAEPSETVPAEPTPTPEPEAQLPAFGEQIVVVTATATASNGAVLNLSYTAFEPVDSASSDGQQILAYLVDQGDTSEITTTNVVEVEKPIIMPFSIVATAEGDAVWPADQPVRFDLGAPDVSTVVGLPATAPQSILLTGPGDGNAFALIWNLPGKPIVVDDWSERFAFYGISTYETPFVVSDCSVFVTPYAEQFEVVATQWRVFDCVVGVGD